MSYILFFSFYFLIKIISVSSSSKYFQILQNNINNYLAEEIPIEFLSKIDNCLENYANSTFENRSYILGKCVINETKENVDILAKLLKNPDTYKNTFRTWPRAGFAASPNGAKKRKSQKKTAPWSSRRGQVRRGDPIIKQKFF